MTDANDNKQGTYPQLNAFKLAVVVTQLGPLAAAAPPENDVSEEAMPNKHIRQQCPRQRHQQRASYLCQLATSVFG
jgi:hypothetical protein